jgi:hypothetical protein
MMNGKKFFLLAALLVVCFGAQVTEAAAAPKSINSCQTIDESGSYLLTRNLTATGDCLVLTVDNVTIDLGGFTITGDGTGSGIWDGAAQLKNITVRNGVITNFQIGINLDAVGNGHSSQNVVERVHAIQNAFAGIRAGVNSIVRDNIANDNGQHGIFANVGSLVTGNVVNNNNNTGILANCPSNIIGNTVTGNRVFNIFLGAGVCTLYNNNPAP